GKETTEVVTTNKDNPSISPFVVTTSVVIRVRTNPAVNSGKETTEVVTIAVLNQLWKTLTPNPSPRTGEGR
ncbi:MAG: hypothetical protein ACRC8Y_00560, partial [Chroococcales cyanobacterium]